MSKRILKWQSFIVKVCLSCVLVGSIYLLSVTVNRPAIAQSDLSLRSDVISLKARISRLEQEVNSLQSQNSKVPKSPPVKLEQPATPPKTRPTIVNPPVVDGEVVGRSDPLYERLATLLIELKEDVRNIDRRLTKIEQATP